MLMQVSAIELARFLKSGPGPEPEFPAFPIPASSRSGFEPATARVQK
jgi:hypothetical protein